MRNRVAICLAALGLSAGACSGPSEEDFAERRAVASAGESAQGGSAGVGGAGGGAGTSVLARGGAPTSAGASGSGGTASAGRAAGDGGRAGATGPSAGMSGSGDPSMGTGGFGLGGSGDVGGRVGLGGRPQGGSGGLGLAGMAGLGMSGTGGASSCPGNGRVTYTLAKSANPTAEQQEAYALITTAMDKAVGYYDCYTNLTKTASVSFVPSVNTADGNSNGSIRFGKKKYMEYSRAMHELAHTMGVGTTSQWAAMLEDGVVNAPLATAKLRELTGIANDQVHGDTAHFWPYGLNYPEEVKSEADLINHCYIVAALRQDMRLD